MRLTGPSIGFAIVLASLGCGDGPSPTAPVVSLPGGKLAAPPGTPSNPDGNGTLAGRITDAVNGDPVPRASVEIAGAGTVETGADGTFFVEAPQTMEAAVSTTIEASGYWPRATHVSTTSAREADATLFPQGNGFDLDFFDHVFRDLGERGTRRWTVDPTFEIWTRLFECAQTGEDGFCEELEATSEDAPPRFLNLAREVFLGDAPLYTGGAVSGGQVTTLTHAPGTRIPEAMQSEIGKITIAMVELPHSTSFATWWSFTRTHAISRSHIQLNSKHEIDRGVYSHELAHALGYRHPLGGESVPLRSIMRDDFGSGPTRNDVLHGRLMYSRPPDSLTPDEDPEGFLVNGLRAPSLEAGPETRSVEQ